MHSMAASAATRGALAGEILSMGSARVLLGANTPLAPLPLLEERGHVAGEILDHRQIGERPDLELAVLDHLRRCACGRSSAAGR